MTLYMHNTISEVALTNISPATKSSHDFMQYLPLLESILEPTHSRVDLNYRVFESLRENRRPTTW